MSAGVGTILRTITRTKPPFTVPKIPTFFPTPLFGHGTPVEDDIGFGPGPMLGPDGPGGPSGPSGPPDDNPVPVGGDEPEIDWDKIMDPGADPLLPDPLEEWSYLFQSWCVHTGHTLANLTRKSTAKQLIKYQAPWLAVSITTFPRYILSVKRLQAYLEEWGLVSDIISAGFTPQEGLDPADIKNFGDSKTLLAKLITQLRNLPNCKWTGFMTSSVGTNPQVPAGDKGTTKGGLKPRPSSTGGHSGSDQSDDGDEDFNPGDSANDRPDQDQSRQRQWEAHFLAWRTDLITVLQAIRQPANSAQITALIVQIRAGPQLGSNQAQINATLTVWEQTTVQIRAYTDFPLLPAQNLDHRLDIIFGAELAGLRAGLRNLVNAHPNYQYHP